MSRQFTNGEALPGILGGLTPTGRMQPQFPALESSYDTPTHPYPSAERQEADRKRIEAQGIADFQSIVSQVRVRVRVDVKGEVESET